MRIRPGRTTRSRRSAISHLIMARKALSETTAAAFFGTRRVRRLPGKRRRCDYHQAGPEKDADCRCIGSGRPSSRPERTFSTVGDYFGLRS